MSSEQYQAKQDEAREAGCGCCQEEWQRGDQPAHEVPLQEPALPPYALPCAD